MQRYCDVKILQSKLHVGGVGLWGVITQFVLLRIYCSAVSYVVSSSSNQAGVFLKEEVLNQHCLVGA